DLRQVPAVGAQLLRSGLAHEAVQAHVLDFALRLSRCGGGGRTEVARTDGRQREPPDALLFAALGIGLLGRGTRARRANPPGHFSGAGVIDLGGMRQVQRTDEQNWNFEWKANRAEHEEIGTTTRPPDGRAEPFVTPDIGRPAQIFSALAAPSVHKL